MLHGCREQVELSLLSVEGYVDESKRRVGRILSVFAGSHVIVVSDANHVRDGSKSIILLVWGVGNSESLHNHLNGYGLDSVGRRVFFRVGAQLTI